MDVRHEKQNLTFGDFIELPANLHDLIDMLLAKSLENDDRLALESVSRGQTSPDSQSNLFFERVAKFDNCPLVY